ncbi:MAG: hypothetical protein FD122_2832 [Stygiobacter sp.]|nr:MAG: hypothetical protein FD122_2832 [Stygiobacter sp.]KAF0213223.1 MAG: hypothetical protein FD178_2936 [Ignavibacteria bacterium]
MDTQIDQIKKQILEELGYLTYMERKNIRDSHDPVFIDKELKRIRTQKRFQLVFGSCWTILTVTYILLFLFDTKQVFTNKDIVLRSIITVSYFSLSLSYVYGLADNRKRESLYKILSVFNNHNTKTV